MSAPASFGELSRPTVHSNSYMFGPSLNGEGCCASGAPDATKMTQPPRAVRFLRRDKDRLYLLICIKGPVVTRIARLSMFA